MNKINLHILENFDFKYALDKCSGKYTGSDAEQIAELLNNIELINKLDDKKRDKIKSFCAYHFGRRFHLDDSDGKNKYIRAIYNVLWGRVEESGYNHFRNLFIFLENESEDSLLWGGDTVNTVKTVLDWENCMLAESDYIELFECYHYIGNFVLVPAYFNQKRGVFDKRILKHQLYDFFDAALFQLKKEGWNVSTGRACSLKIVGTNSMKHDKLKSLLEDEINKLKEGGACEKAQLLNNEINDLEKYKNIPSDCNELRKRIENDLVEITKTTEIYQRKGFLRDDFSTYINTMFLWDYTKKRGNEYIIKSLCKKEFQDEGEGCEYDIKGEVEEVESRRNEMNESKVRQLYVCNAKYAIERRSVFMVAMLGIALGKNFDGKSEYIYNGENQEIWKNWNVSGIYKKIMDDVFLSNNVYADYLDVIERKADVKDVARIKDVVEEIRNKNSSNIQYDEDVKYVEDILEKLKNELGKK